jgi:hypothetical protein
MEEEFNKMTIKGQKSAILLVRALLNHPKQLDYIRDNYLVKRHGSWQLRNKLSVMLYTNTKHEHTYLSRIDKTISNNNKKEVIQAILIAASVIIAGIGLAILVLKMGGVI